MPQIGKSQKNQTKISRKEEIILSRLRTGHSHITHSYLLKKEEAPYCIPCQKPYTIKHINRMHRLRTNTEKILPYNKLKTNFL